MIDSTNTIEAEVKLVELRPMFDYGDHCVVCSIFDADYFGVYAAPDGQPACQDEIFDTADEAFDHIFQEGRYAGARLWYNGNDQLIEITCRDDVFIALADAYCASEDDFIDPAEIVAMTAAVKGDTVIKNDSPARASL